MILALGLLAACAQLEPPKTPSNLLGTLELSVDGGAQPASARVQPQTVIGDASATFTSLAFTDFVDTTTNTRYLKASFTVTNNTASPFSNLTLYAFNQASSSVGGTALKSLTNFAGGSTNQNAQSLLPTHGMAGATAPDVVAGEEDFQGFQTSETTAIKSAAQTLGVLGASDTVLEYGFVARNASGGRSIQGTSCNPGSNLFCNQGRITIAYRLPNTRVNPAYRFVATFVLSNETLTRVTRSAEETSANALARATALGATQVVFAGTDKDTGSGVIRVPNLKIGTTPTNLLSPYHIELQFSSGISETYKAAFRRAARRWEDILRNELSDVTTTISPSDCGLSTGFSAVTGTDDLLIFADASAIDGVGGVLGQSGTCTLRASNGLPAVGVMQFDSADLASLATQGLLQDTIAHEMAHVIGYGAINQWDSRVSGLGGADPRFIGPKAVAEWQALGGSGNVPVENSGGSGTQDSHWREVTFKNELMTGYINPGGNPLSRLSVAALEDMGYAGAKYDYLNSYSLPMPITLSVPNLARQGHFVLHRATQTVDDRP